VAEKQDSHDSLDPSNTLSTRSLAFVAPPDAPYAFDNHYRPRSLLTPSSTRARTRPPVFSMSNTPAISEETQFHLRVAPPVVIGIDSAVAAAQGGIRLVPTTSYANYQPGVHSTAGPLPPPPRLPFEALSASASSPPPRPPRLNSPLPPRGHTPLLPRSAARNKDLEAVKQALQLPPSVTAALSPKHKAHPTLNAQSQFQKPKHQSSVTQIVTPQPIVAVARCVRLGLLLE